MINLGQGQFWKHRLLRGKKVTTRSQISVYRINDPMKTIAAIDLKHDQDGRYTHIWEKKNKQKKKHFVQ